MNLTESGDTTFELWPHWGREKILNCRHRENQRKFQDAINCDMSGMVTLHRFVYVCVCVCVCTASLTFNNPTFCPHSVFMCFVWISEQTAIISLCNINWLVCIYETECVYCAVRTDCLYITQVTRAWSLKPKSMIFPWICSEAATNLCSNCSAQIFKFQLLYVQFLSDLPSTIPKPATLELQVKLINYRKVHNQIKSRWNSGILLPFRPEPFDSPFLAWNTNNRIHSTLISQHSALLAAFHGRSFTEGGTRTFAWRCAEKFRNYFNNWTLEMLIAQLELY